MTTTIVTGALAALLLAGTVVTAVTSVSSSTTDRVPDATSTGPVYGAP